MSPRDRQQETQRSNRPMRIKVYSLKPGPKGFVIDKKCLHCIIEVRNGKGSFRFYDASREKLIREIFDAPSSVFVSGGQMPDGMSFDAVETHPAWSDEAIEAIVKEELYGLSLGATIEREGNGLRQWMRAAERLFGRR